MGMYIILMWYLSYSQVVAFPVWLWVLALAVFILQIGQCITELLRN